MIVNDKYRLGALVRSGEVATFEAQEISTGRSVYVHLMGVAPATASLAAQVREHLAAGSRGFSSPLIEQGEYDGAPFVVSEATPELVDLKRWIEAQPAPGSVVAEPSRSGPSSPSAASGPGDAGAPGEFTRLFQGSAGEEASPAHRPPPATGSPQPQPPASVAGTGGGFDAGSSPLPGPPQPQAPQPQASRPPGQEPGEFTQMFGASRAPTDPESSSAASLAPVSPHPGHTEAHRDVPPPTSPNASGGVQETEFTRSFRESQAGKPATEPGSPAPSRTGRQEPPASQSAPSATGTQRDLTPTATPAGADPAPGGGEFTRLLGGKQGVGEKGAEPPAVPASPRKELPPEPPAARPPQATRPPGKAYEEPSTWQTGEFASFRPGPPPSEPLGQTSPPGVAEPGVTESGSRRISPEERRQEMRQFRMVSRPGVEPPRPAPEAEHPPASPPDQPPTVSPPLAGPGKSKEPGEFTRLFQGPPASAPGSPPVTPQGPSAPPPPAGSPDGRSATQLGGPGPTLAASLPRAPEQPGEEGWTRPSPPAQPPAPPSAGTFSPPHERPGGPGVHSAGPPQVDQTGEFTKLFRQGKPPSGRPEPVLPASPPAAPPSAAPGSPGSGEFTRLFGSEGRPDPWGDRPHPTPPTESDPWSDRPHSPPPQASEPGAFTRIFGGGGGAGSQSGDPFSGGSGSPWPADPQRQTLEPDNQSGDFTKMFGGKSGKSSGGSADWPDKRHEPGGATQIAREPSPPPHAPPSPPVQGPSDYTRMMGNAPPPPRQQGSLPEQVPGYQSAPPPLAPPPAYPASPQAYAAPPAAAAPPPPGPMPAAQPPAAQPQPARQRTEREPGGSERSMYLILALLFCALLVVALGIVLFVSLTGEREEQTAPAPQTQQEGAPAAAASPASGLNPSLAVPGVRPPSVTSPSLTPPSVTAPSLSGSGISGGSVTAPSVLAPSVSGPSVSTPRLPTVPRVSSGQIPATAAPQPGAQPAAAETGGTPYFVLIIILSILLVIAVGAAVYFALRRA